MDIRAIIQGELRRREMSAYALAKAAGLPLRGVQTWLAGGCDIKGERLGQVLDALGLEISRKASKRKGR